jgi:hypothetical protein
VRWSLREHGVVLAGPEPQELIEPVAPEDLRSEARHVMADYAVWVQTADLSRRAQGLTVLTFCRALHTLTTARVTSKAQAGGWALRTLDHRWHGLIRRALDDRPDPWTKVREPAEPALMRETLGFVQYALDLSLSEPKKRRPDGPHRDTLLRPGEVSERSEAPPRRRL